jgi:chromate transporter
MIDPAGTPSTSRVAPSVPVAEIFTAFLKLGLTSFGGPIAHLGYFHRELVVRRHWLDEARFAQLVALCQFLPGPGSSQFGFALGLIRGGWRGALAASFAFTAPSVLILLAFAHFIPLLHNRLGQAAIHGLKLVAVTVVAHGLLGMARTLAPDTSRRLIAIFSMSIILMTGSAAIQLLAVMMGALLGALVCRDVTTPETEGFELRYQARTGLLILLLFALLLAISLTPIWSTSPLAAVAAAFYRAGALVFGGGHVVLPLLQEAVVTPGWVTQDDFLAGYGGAQAVPGPMFSVAAFLGARIENIGGTSIGALVSLLAILAPGFLLVAGVLPLWRSITRHPGAARALAGVNAAVVGLLGAALYDPVWTSAIQDLQDVAIALIGFVLLVRLRASSLVVVAWCIMASMLRASLP